MSQITTQSWNAAVEEQFPWIAKLLTGTSGDRLELTERIVIGKVSAELLEVVPSEDSGTELSEFWTQDLVEFWSIDGEQLGAVESARSHADARQMNQDRDGETIGDGLARLAASNAERTAFITRYQFTSSGVLSHSPDGRTLAIFKVADFDLAGWFAERRRAAGDAVLATVQGGISLPRFIDFLETLTSSCNTASAGLQRGEYRPRDGETIASELNRVAIIKASAQSLIDESREGGAIARTFPLGINC